MLEAITEMLNQIPSIHSTALFETATETDAYCCISCRQEIFRVPVTIPKRGGVFTGYALSVCKCVVRAEEKREGEQRRRLRRGNMERVYKKSMMNEGLLEASFENFEPRAGTEEVKAAAEDFVEEFERRKEGILFFGPVGNGKSHLAAAIHHALNKQDHVCLFLDCAQLFNLAKDTFRRDSRTSLTDIINAAIQADLLTLDEIGSGFLTEYEFNDILFPIINGRQGKPTNFTTNLDPDRLGRWFQRDKQGKSLDMDGRLIDRILGSCDIYENKATSKRKENAMRRYG